MSEPKIDLVNAKAFTINFPSVGSPVAISTKGDEIVISMRLTIRPRDNVMDFNFDVSTSGDSAPMASFDKNAPFDFGRYFRSVPIRRDHSIAPDSGAIAERREPVS
jgi:hypothetical protein